jgi:hypothetical protein
MPAPRRYQGRAGSRLSGKRVELSDVPTHLIFLPPREIAGAVASRVGMAL